MPGVLYQAMPIQSYDTLGSFGKFDESVHRSFFFLLFFSGGKGGGGRGREAGG